MKTAKTTILAIAASLAITACNNGSQNTQPVEAQSAEEIQIDTIVASQDTVSQESFAEFAKEVCGLNINLDSNVWLPSYEEKNPNGFRASYYTKDDVDIEAMLDNFLLQCINASEAKEIGIDPKYKTVAEAREHLVEKLMKNVENPAEDYSYSYLSEKIFYVHNGAKIIAKIIFTKGVGTNTMYYELVSQ